MYGVQKNIQHLCSRTRSKTWGADAWKKVRKAVLYGLASRLTRSNPGRGSDSVRRTKEDQLADIVRLSSTRYLSRWHCEECCQWQASDMSCALIRLVLQTKLNLQLTDLRVHNANSSHAGHEVQRRRSRYCSCASDLRVERAKSEENQQ